MPLNTELAELLSGLRPAELALRDWVRTRLNASIVREMAELDHGMQVDEHRRSIEALLVARRLPDELAWTPREVLELASHEVPRSVGGHVARLFSCLVLVRANDTVLPARVLAGLVESALELGPEATDHAVRYLAWCRLHEPGAWRDDAEALPFLTLGLLLLYVMAPGGGDPAIAGGLARAFEGEVQAPKTALKAATGGEGWRIWQRLVDRSPIDSTGGGGGPGEGLAMLVR